ncbi:MAG: hypothetical protein NC115_11650 [Bacteroidales bacterium]|nr:hypothetical protein [Bacteroides sp.]MCM1198852.1 hypothetical protein [Clostridium sp.]MCM1503300.1 hypothetical protein [Bacteroidales bacterium]
MKDSVTVTASLLGYKTLSLKTAFKAPSMSIFITMAEDVKELNAVIVKANTVLMVSKGDTTVYNVEQIKTMDGDNLSQLLKKLPGINIDNGKVTAGGRPVNKILINGSTLFGSNISAALTLIESDMVKKIRVYDEHPQDRLIEADTLGVKDHVIDVVTKEPLTKIRSAKLYSAIGIFTDKNNEGSNDMLAGLGGNYSRFEKDSPQIQASVKTDKNENCSEPKENVNGDFSIENNRKFKDNYSNYFYINATRNVSNNSSHTEYREIDRSSSDSQHKDALDTKAGYRGSYSFKADEQNTFGLYGDVSFKARRSFSEKAGKTEFNGIRYNTGMSDIRHGKALNADISLRYRHHFTKPGRSLDISIQLLFRTSWDDRNIVDTLQSTSYRQWTDEDMRSTGFTPHFKLSYSEPLGSNGLMFRMSADGTGSFSKDRRYSFDRLLMTENTVKTYDYTQNNIAAKADAGLYYRKDKFDITAGISADVTNQIVNERDMTADSFAKTYFLASPFLRLNYRGQKFTTKLSYAEKGLCPSVESLRKSLDYTDPMSLFIGNPNLRLPVNRLAELSLNLSSFSIGTTWALYAKFSHTSNMIGNDTEYLTDDTYLESHAYQAVAGAQIVRTQNIGNGWNLNAGISAGFHINPIKSSFIVKVGTMNSRAPFMTNGQSNMSGTDEFNFSLTYTSGFSRVFSLNVMTDGGLGQNILNSNKVYSYFQIHLNARPRLVLFKHWDISAEYILSNMITDMKDTGYLTNRLDVMTGYKFGKSRKYRAGITVSDCLNSNKSHSVSFEELYIRRATNTLLGRGVSVNFSIEFK